MTKKKDGRAIAHHNEVRVLRSIARFGWLRTRDIAVLCWTVWSIKPVAAFELVRIFPSSSGWRMAQRTLKRLAQKRCVLASKAPDGCIVYTLAEGGARALRERGFPAQSGKDLVRGFSNAFFRHRCIANEVAIAAIVQGYRASTEREIAQGAWFGGLQGVEGKRPDVVVKNQDQILFCEVEKSRKNKTEYQDLLSWLVKMSAVQGARNLACGNEKVVLAKVIFVCTLAFQKKLRKDLVALGLTAAKQDQLISYSTDLYDLRSTMFS